jgi:hypothetical protein
MLNLVVLLSIEHGRGTVEKFGEILTELEERQEQVL